MSATGMNTSSRFIVHELGDRRSRRYHIVPGMRAFYDGTSARAYHIIHLLDLFVRARSKASRSLGNP